MKKVRTIRIDKEVSDNLDSICTRHGDVSWHIEQALNGYPPIRAIQGPEPVFPKKKPQPVEPLEDYLFDRVWELYGKKGNKKTSKIRFSKLSEESKKAIWDHMPAYVISTPDKQYRKDFQTYLNQECWNDEVTTHETTQGLNQPRRSSVVDRVHAINEQREQARRVEERALDGQAMGTTTGDLRPPTEQPVRGDDTGELGTVIDGSFTRAD